MAGVPAADRAPTRPAAALVAMALLVVTGWAALSAIRTPAVVPVDAPAGEFSAARAYEQVRAVAVEPHVAGSTANDRVREHLLDTLRGLGLSPEVQDAVSVEGGTLSAGRAGIGVGRVRNVVTLIPGSAPTGRIFLVAHYDSVQAGPG